jgi:hypothetical protein
MLHKDQHVRKTYGKWCLLVLDTQVFPIAVTRLHVHVQAALVGSENSGGNVYLGDLKIQIFVCTHFMNRRL